MAKAKQVFKSGNFLKAGSVLAHGSHSWLLKALHDHEMGFCGRSLYIKVGGELVPIKEQAYDADEVASYLYKMDYDYYEGYEGLIMQGSPAACTAFRLGTKVGRNLDWYYSSQIDFVITCHKAGCYKSIGVASHPGIQGASVSSTDYRLAELPWYTQDGVNEKGLFVCHNVVPDDIAGGLTDAIPTGSTKVVLDSRQVTRYCLDNFQSVDEAVGFLKQHAKILKSKDLEVKGYGVHYMLSDSSKTVVLEIVAGRLRCIDATCMTNFYLAGVDFNADGTVCSNADVPSGYLPTEENCITPKGAGLERFNTVKQYSGSDARALLDLVKYSRLYTETTSPWYSELAGIAGITVDTPPTDSTMQQALAAARAAYASRSRETSTTWHTTHSCVYDLENLSLSVVPQETGTAYDFTLEAE